MNHTDQCETLYEITTVIMAAVTQAQLEGQDPPSRVYLGLRQWDAIGMVRCPFGALDPRNTDRPRFMGLECFQVLEDDHVQAV